MQNPRLLKDYRRGTCKTHVGCVSSVHERYEIARGGRWFARRFVRSEWDSETPRASSSSLGGRDFSVGIGMIQREYNRVYFNGISVYSLRGFEGWLLLEPGPQVRVGSYLPRCSTPPYTHLFYSASLHIYAYSLSLHLLYSISFRFLIFLPLSCLAWAEHSPTDMCLFTDVAGRQHRQTNTKEF